MSNKPSVEFWKASILAAIVGGVIGAILALVGA